MKIVAVAALALAVSASAAGAGPRSGLRGMVLIEPAFPVCHVDQPCTKPADDVLLVFSRKGRASRRTRTNEDGTYRIRLAPGRWTVTAPGRAGPGLSRALDPARVLVPRGGYRRVTFTLDIGIR
jgi:hypothetical protein